MPRPPGPHNERDSQPLAVRVPNELYAAIAKVLCSPPVDLKSERTKAEFKANFPAWARRVFSAAAGSPRGGTLGGAQLEGYEEGKRQGWAHANRVFREALQKAAAALKR